MLMTALGQLVIYPVDADAPPYNAVADFEPVVPLVRTPWVLYINKDVPATTSRSSSYAKTKPGALNGATPGVGTTNHLATRCSRRHRTKAKPSITTAARRRSRT